MSNKIVWTKDSLAKLPTTRGDGIVANSRYYFNGSLCKKHKHYCARITASGKCHYCLRETSKLRKRKSDKRKKLLGSEYVPNKLPSENFHGLSRSYQQMLYNSAKQRAKRRGIKFEISVTDIDIPKVCPILGIELNTVWGSSQQNNTSRANVPSLDRLDSAKGYEKGNIIVISYRANILKGSGTAEEHRKVAVFLQKYGL
jgi:hypothetical protein